MHGFGINGAMVRRPDDIMCICQMKASLDSLLICVDVDVFDAIATQLTNSLAQTKFMVASVSKSAATLKAL
eukprot:10267938-Lingulodinium_polyedra.AAC.1